MNKEKFNNHLINSTALVIALTKQLCFNDLNQNYKYIVTPNERTPNTLLTEEEIEILNVLNKYEDQILTGDEVVSLLHKNNKVPLWINMSVFASKPNSTIVEFFCSRRFRDETELYKENKYPPFHPVVPIPPESIKIEIGGRFDINWKKRINEGKNLFIKIKQFFS